MWHVNVECGMLCSRLRAVTSKPHPAGFSQDTGFSQDAAKWREKTRRMHPVNRMHPAASCEILFEHPVASRPQIILVRRHSIKNP